MFGSSVFGVDLGTSEIKIYSLKNDRTIVEKNMVAVRNGDHLLAVGNDAFEMYEKNPANVEVTSPVTEGAISDLIKVEAILHVLLKKSDRRIAPGSSVFFSVPPNRSQIERRAYYRISEADSLKNPHVYLVDRPICDAIALGIPLSRTKGSMIVNIGARNTDISVIAGGQVIISNSIPVGGQQMNEAICELIRRSNNLLIGHRTARRLKAVLATFGDELHEARRVVGVNTLSGIPREGIISARLVGDAVLSETQKIAHAIRDFLTRTPPQITKAILGEGIYLTGGTTRIPQIDTYFSRYIGCRVNLSSYYNLCTIRGLTELIQHKVLQKWAVPVRKGA